MTRKPLEPKGVTDCIEIGKKIHTVSAGKADLQDVAKYIRKRTKRGGDDAECHVSFASEVATDNKLVVVPEKTMIDESLADLGDLDPNDGYDLLEPYIVQAARVILKRWGTAGGSLEDLMRDIAGTPSADDLKKFFYLRLGEYCINQCK